MAIEHNSKCTLNHLHLLNADDKLHPGKYPAQVVKMTSKEKEL